MDNPEGLLRASARTHLRRRLTDAHESEIEPSNVPQEETQPRVQDQITATEPSGEVTRLLEIRKGLDRCDI